MHHVPKSTMPVKYRRGKRTFLHVQSKGRDDLPAPAYTGGKRREGTAFLFQFPYDIYVSKDDLTEPQTSVVDQFVIKVYPPFWNPGGLSSVAEVTPEAIPFQHGTLPPNHDKNRVKSLDVDYGLGSPANALRIDIQPSPTADFAARVADHFVELVRWWTRQWWIKRGRVHQSDPLRNHFAINDVGERLSGIEGYKSIYGNFGMEVPLDLELMQNIRGNISHGRRIPLSFDAFLDGVYFHAARELRRAVLELAIACEAGIGEAAEALAEQFGHSRSRVKRAMRADDFTVKLAKGIPSLGGGRFNKERPGDFALLQRLRTTRGNVAHGGPPLTEEGRKATEEEVFQMADATHDLLYWLGSMNEATSELRTTEVRI